MTTIERKTAIQELLLIAVLAVLQPVCELTLGETTAHYYNYVAVLIGAAYVLLRARRHPELWSNWGIRMDNLREALPSFLSLGILGGAALYVYGGTLGHTPLPSSYWIILPLYIVWGLLQQFALQNLFVRNLGVFLPSITVRSLIVALCFGAVHLPSIPLAVLAAIFGFVITLLFHRHANLLAAAVAHGIVGSLVFYAILGRDEWREIMQHFS